MPLFPAQRLEPEWPDRHPAADVGRQRPVPNADPVRWRPLCWPAGLLTQPASLAAAPALLELCVKSATECARAFVQYPCSLAPFAAASWQTTSSPAPCPPSGAITTPCSAPWSACEPAHSSFSPQRCQSAAGLGCACLGLDPCPGACHTPGSSLKLQFEASSPYFCPILQRPVKLRL